MLKYTFTSILIICLQLLPVSESIGSTTRYVTDELTIPLRTGTTNRHKILRFIPSGTMLTIMETSEDGEHIKTEFDGVEGWVQTKQLMENPGAKEQLLKIQRRLDAITKDNAPLQQKLDQANKQVDELTEKNRELTREKEQLQITLKKIKDSAAHPIKIAEENERLSNEILTQQDKNQTLIKENAMLKDRSIKEWFAIGAAVSLGSLVFGLIIPSISWRKKKSWGDF